MNVSTINKQCFFYSTSSVTRLSHPAQLRDRKDETPFVISTLFTVFNAEWQRNKRLKEEPHFCSDFRFDCCDGNGAELRYVSSSSMNLIWKFGVVPPPPPTLGSRDHLTFPNVIQPPINPAPTSFLIDLTSVISKSQIGFFSNCMFSHLLLIYDLNIETPRNASLSLIFFTFVTEY